MTKLKSKKMTKSTFAVIIMAIAMVAMLAFGGTYAYFTATAKDIATGDVSTAIISLTSGGATINTDTVVDILPGEKAFDAQAVNTLTHGSTRDIYVFVTMTTTCSAGDLLVRTGSEGAYVYSDVFTSTTSWTALEGHEGVYYTTANAIAGTQEESVGSLTFTVDFSSSVDSNNDETDGETSNVYVADSSVEGGYKNVDIMGVTVSVSLSFSAIQQDGFADDANMEAEGAKSAVVKAYEAL